MTDKTDDSAFSDKCAQGMFRNLRRYYEWQIEWDVATGIILMSSERTRAAGERKMIEAEAKEAILRDMIRAGRL